MKLSELVYNVVKNVKYLDDINFNYEAFVKGEFDNDQDYTNSINNAFTPINEAIHRLSDRNKIAYVCLNLGKHSGGVINYKIPDHPVKKIKSVFIIRGNNYENVEYREMGRGKIFILSDLETEYHMQYIEDIKNFTRYDYEYTSDNLNPLIMVKDVDLFDFGINEDMCSYIIEYAQGKLQETIAPDLASLHLIRAEQYFEDLDEQQTFFSQKTIKLKTRAL